MKYNYLCFVGGRGRGWYALYENLDSVHTSPKIESHDLLCLLLLQIYYFIKRNTFSAVAKMYLQFATSQVSVH
jgi:hypothetical protein